MQSKNYEFNSQFKHNLHFFFVLSN